MPTYQYRCGNCDHQFEQFQRFSEDPLLECPVCGGVIRRVIQPVGVVFKGSGWYITDSRATSGTGADERAPAKGKKAEEPAAATADKATTKDGADKAPKEAAKTAVAD